ncbi:mevalonate kinase [Apilactobacillus sp. TMW 2.2459]|uniref:Mevalonate kinase n=1 Tax=Apilactobacillus xinyiensis TaxID=2841032 RepID=A0ABT0I005_9LACO|nr:mevalonate kinase [Apilactobacillus xinyiensis]MCK8624133.1 mevalonate kinase [Apilactobacillus xinyiensis]MCL0311725.1 mevalonate kinase [Apilactobacillus xinyiensis]
MEKSSIGMSHAKIILMGEHSVVYKEPAIALPITSIKLKVEIKKCLSNNILITSHYYKGPLQNVPVNMLGIKKLIDQTLKNLNKEKETFNIIIKSSIPSERGMGSSAATAVGIIRAIYKYFDKKISRKQLLKLSDVEEKITHGNPSGLDAATVSSEYPIWFIHGQENEQIPFNINGYLIIADSGILGRTDIAVNYVRELVNHKNEIAINSINNLGNAVRQAKECLEKGNIHQLGKLMDFAHQQLQNIQISNPTVDKIVNITKANGALGAKLTGSGLGGCVISITDNLEKVDKIINALKKQGVKDIWTQKLGSIN